MPNLGGGKARCNLRDVPMVNSLFLNLIVTHVHMYTFQKLKLGGGGGGGRRGGWGGGRKQSVRIIGDSKIANAHD